MSKKCIVCWSSLGRENYPSAQLKLIRSCINTGWDGDYIMQTLDGYVDEYLGVKIEQGAYPKSERWQLANNNSEIPYAFKPELIQVARERGYEQVIWCDSSIRLFSDPTPLLELAKEKGVVAFDNLGHPFRNYVSDVCLKMLHIPYEELDKVPQIMACVVIFDFTNEKAVRVFDKWIATSRDGVSFQNGYGSTRPEFVAHRHDQVVLSGLMYKEGIELLPYGGLCYHPNEITKQYGEPIYFVNKGMN